MRSETLIYKIIILLFNNMKHGQFNEKSYKLFYLLLLDTKELTDSNLQIKDVSKVYVNRLMNLEDTRLKSDLHKEVQNKMKTLKARIHEYILYLGDKYKYKEYNKTDLYFNVSAFKNDVIVFDTKSLKSLMAYKKELKNACYKLIKIKTLKNYNKNQNFDFDLNMYDMLARNSFAANTVSSELLTFNGLFESCVYKNNINLLNIVLFIAQEGQNKNTVNSSDVSIYTPQLLIQRMLTTLIVRLTNAFLNIQNDYSFNLFDNSNLTKLSDENSQSVIFKQLVFLQKLLNHGVLLKNYFIVD